MSKLMSLLTLGFFLISCNSSPSSQVSSSHIIEKNKGSCLTIEYATPVEKSKISLNGPCPLETESSGQSFVAIKKCPPYKDKDKNEYQEIVYDHFLAEDGSIQFRSSEQAINSCTEAKNVYQIPQK